MKRIFYIFFALGACSSPEQLAAPTSLEHFVVMSVRDVRREVHALREQTERQRLELAEVMELQLTLDAEIELIKLKMREREEIADGIEAPPGK